MPPVMGAASFVMAEFLGVPYWHVMVAAAIPALFYYGALFAAIHFNASRAGLRGLPREELPRLRDVLWRHGHLLAPVVVIFLLLLQGFTATYAALVATLAVVYAWLLGRWVWPLVAGGAALWIAGARDVALGRAGRGRPGRRARPTAAARAPSGISCGATARWRCGTAPSRRCRSRWRRPPRAS